MTKLPMDMPSQKNKKDPDDFIAVTTQLDDSGQSAVTPAEIASAVTVKKSATPVSQADLKPPKEINGPKGLEPTRYGDWESRGRCHDF